MVKKIKQIHTNSVICFQVGNFYNCYGKDSYILSYIFGYKIKDITENIPMAGFPKNALSKVKAALERKKINYIIIDTRNNYNVDEEQNFENLNCYEEIFEKAYENIKIQRRIERISEFLKESKDKNILRKIEEIIYEARKV